MKNILAFVLLFITYSADSQRIQLSSPDKKIMVEIKNAVKITYSVKIGRTTVLLESPLGFEFDNNQSIGNAMSIVDSTRSVVNEKWTQVAGKHKFAFDICNEIHLQLKESHEPQRRIDILFRLYNDGVAFRYFLPMQNGISSPEIAKEVTGFRFPKNLKAWASNNCFKSSGNTETASGAIGDLTEKSNAALPLFVKVDEQCYVTIAEANTNNFSGINLCGIAEGKEAGVLLNIKQLDEPDQNEHVKEQLSNDFFSPWRVIIIGNEPGRIIESEMILNLNEPSVLANSLWIKPGKIISFNTLDTTLTVNTDLVKNHIDYTSKLDFPYMLIGNQLHRVEISKPDSAIDMPEVLRYAKEKKVRCWLYVNYADIEKLYKEAFPIFAQWGVAGITVDCKVQDDKQMGNIYRKIISEAARYRLMINFLGSFKADGIQRTYPNVLLSNGLKGIDNKNSPSIKLENNVNYTFTSMLAGSTSMFSRNLLLPTTQLPTDTINTLCNKLAMFVVYDGSTSIVCDSRDTVFNTPKFNFVKALPNSWDDTKVLKAKPDEYIITARKAGSLWFVGAITNGDARDIELPLDFLGTGKFEGNLFSDTPDFKSITETKTNVTSATKLKIKMFSGGGFAAYFNLVK